MASRAAGRDSPDPSENSSLGNTVQHARPRLRAGRCSLALGTRTGRAATRLEHTLLSVRRDTLARANAARRIYAHRITEPGSTSRGGWILPRNTSFGASSIQPDQLNKPSSHPLRVRTASREPSYTV